jgi:hypothetical protein
MIAPGKTTDQCSEAQWFRQIGSNEQFAKVDRIIVMLKAGHSKEWTFAYILEVSTVVEFTMGFGPAEY